MLFVLIFALLALVYVGVLVWERRVLGNRKRQPTSEQDYDVFMGGAGAVGGGIGAAYQRQLGLEGDEGPREREELEAPKFNLPD